VIPKSLSRIPANFPKLKGSTIFLPNAANVKDCISNKFQTDNSQAQASPSTYPQLLDQRCLKRITHSTVALLLA
jgi:hypothetical protein